MPTAIKGMSVCRKLDRGVSVSGVLQIAGPILMLETSREVVKVPYRPFAVGKHGPPCYGFVITAASRDCTLKRLYIVGLTSECGKIKERSSDVRRYNMLELRFLSEESMSRAKIEGCRAQGCPAIQLLFDMRSPTLGRRSDRCAPLWHSLVPVLGQFNTRYACQE